MTSLPPPRNWIPRERALHALYEGGRARAQSQCTYLSAALASKDGVAEGLAPRKPKPSAAGAGY